MAAITEKFHAAEDRSDTSIGVRFGSDGSAAESVAVLTWHSTSCFCFLSHPPENEQGCDF